MEIKERATERETPLKIRGMIHLISPAVIMIITLVVFVKSLSIYLNAKEIGEGIGEFSGKVTGFAVGSYKGVTEGFASGIKDGKEAGLSAEDTEVKMKNEMESVGRLEVLAAGVRIDDIHEYADKYSALYIFKANAVFSVDLRSAKIYQENNAKIMIYLPEPVAELYIDEDAAEKLAEWQKHFYSGNAKDGYDAYINSLANLADKSPQEIQNYEALMEQAKAAALKQVGILAKAVCKEDITVQIVFGNEGE